MPEIQWTVGNTTGEVTDKVEYIPLTKAPANATEEQKESVRLWNAMVKKLRDLGAMEDK